MAIILKKAQNTAMLFTDKSVILPAVRGQNRLEGYPRRDDFSRSLRAEVRDPLWFLTRQWQFGEFKGDDAGSPIDARIKMRRTVLQTYAPRGQGFGPLPTELPLETVVERETIPNDMITLRQISGGVRRALRGQGVSPARIRDIDNFLRVSFPLDSSKIDGHAGLSSRQMLPTLLARLFDGAQFLREVKDGAFDDRVESQSGFNAATKSALKLAATKVVQYFAGLYSQPDDALPSAWNPQQLEYQFECETVKGSKGDRLGAAEYAAGRLDWSAFDYVSPRPGTSAQPEQIDITSFIPAAVTFAGMPNPRFWEMEDRQVEFADINAGTTDLGKLLLTEFALSYANDWVMFPIEADVGSLCEVEAVLVRDVFGENSLIRSVGRGIDDDWQRWSLFGLSTYEANADRRLFVPPSTPTLMEPDPIERIVLLRDEMANMCWAVERVVPSQCGQGISGSAEADAEAEEAPPRAVPDGTVSYGLGSKPPANWVPFVPVRTPGSNRSIHLQRARLPGAGRQPKGQIINEPSPYFINEEEFPRAGRIITRGFQRCRWQNGEIVQWLGRRVATGRGEGSSGMLFDTLDPM